MAQTQRTNQKDELQELRDKIVALEEELKKEHEKTEDDKDDSKNDFLKDTTDVFSKLSMGFIFAGLESLSVAADMTQTFVEQTQARNEKRDTVVKQVSYLPWDLSRASIDTLDKTVSMSSRVLDKFNEKYKEAAK